MGVVGEERLLTSWEDNVEDFFLWLELICERSKDSEVYQTFLQTIHNVDDITAYVKLYFDGDLDNLEDTSEQFLRWKTNKIGA